jgi:hypothetical protein
MNWRGIWLLWFQQKEQGEGDDRRTYKDVKRSKIPPLNRVVANFLNVLKEKGETPHTEKPTAKPITAAPNGLPSFSIAITVKPIAPAAAKAIGANCIAVYV